MKLVKQKRLLFIASAFAIVGITLVVSGPASNEPHYLGRSLSSWLKCYADDKADLQHQKADEAIKQMGTNAIPFLINQLRVKDSPIKVKLFAIGKMLPFLPKTFVSAKEYNWCAMHGFSALGSSASIAVADLASIVEADISEHSLRASLEVLSRLGPSASNAVPAILRAGNSTNLSIRWSSVRALGEIHSNPESVVPVLMRSLQENDSLIRSYAVIALAKFGTQAKNAIPALKLRYAAEDEGMKSEIADALQQIDPNVVGSQPKAR